jgi:glycosyltransferase involved in cell wall biosynthesis
LTVPTASVLIPCYNAEKYIGETLDSIFRQTWRELEIIIVDDGSQDGSICEIERFVDARVRLIRQTNMGASAARNRAYQASRGEFIQFLDADDLIGPDKIERQITRLMDHPNCVASAEWGRFYTGPGETRFEPEPVWRDLPSLDWLSLSRAQGFGMMFPAIWLIPRPVADKAGPWEESLSVGDDGEYFTRVLLASDRVLFCSGAQCHYRSGVTGSLSGRRSSAAWVSQFRVLELCERHVREREESERVRRGFALSWQRFAHSCYPHDRTLANLALSHARLLHPVSIRPHGGPAFEFVSALIGWRIARRLQVISGRS